MGRKLHWPVLLSRPPGWRAEDNPPVAPPAQIPEWMKAERDAPPGPVDREGGER